MLQIFDLQSLIIQSNQLNITSVGLLKYSDIMQSDIKVGLTVYGICKLSDYRFFELLDEWIVPDVSCMFFVDNIMCDWNEKH